MAVNRARKLKARVNGLAVCCITKNAGTSIKRALLEAQGLKEPDIYRTHSHPALNYGENVSGHYVAAFLRHPAARLVSLWQDKILRDRGKPTRALVDQGFEIGMPFADFARHAVECTHSDIHLVPQCEFLPGRVDFYGLVDTLEDDWRALQQRFKWLPDIGHHHATGGDWRQHCDGETLFLIEATYNTDLRLYEKVRSDRHAREGGASA